MNDKRAFGPAMIMLLGGLLLVLIAGQVLLLWSPQTANATRLASGQRPHAMIMTQGSPTTRSSALSLTAYLATIDAAQRDLTQALALSSLARQQAATRVRRRLLAVTVRVRPDSTLAVAPSLDVPPRTSVMNDLASNPARIRDALTRLSALSGALRLVLRGPPLGQIDRQRLAQVYTAAEFQQAVPNPLVSLFEWLISWLGSALHRLGVVPVADQQTAGLLMALLIVALMALISVLTILRFIGGLRPSDRSPQMASSEVGLVVNAPSARQRAREQADASDYRGAVRFLFLAALLDLDSRDILRFDGAIGTRDLVWQLRHVPDLATALAEAAREFEAVWYGHVACDAHVYAAYQARIDDLIRQSTHMSPLPVALGSIA